MTQKTKSILKHIGILLLCLALATGSYFLGRHLYGSAGGGSSHEPDKALQLLGYLVYLICGLLVLGAFLHLRMAVSNARIHCKNCGAKGSLRDYKVLKRNMASDNVHVSNEVIQLNMYCSACGQEFPLKKKFQVSTYNSKHRVWKTANVDKAVRGYAAGTLWF